MSAMISRECKSCGKEFWVSEYNVGRGRGIYCSRDCYFVGLREKHKLSETQRRKFILKCFEKYKTIDPVTGCWLWTKGRNGSFPYGQISVSGIKTLIHRLSMHIYRDFDLSSDLLVCHHCDTPRCFNPDHLFVGTTQDNINDCRTKGRACEKFMRKLDDSQYNEVINQFMSGKTKASIARYMNVCASCIHKIISKKLLILNIGG